MASKKTLEHYLRQMRLIEEHREKWCEQNIRRHYKDLMTDLQEFLGVQYAQLAIDDKLTYEILHGKAYYARFLEEVEERINKFSPQAAQEIRNTVQLTYEKAYEGMVDAVEKSGTVQELHQQLKGIRAVRPEAIKSVVQNKVMEKALEKNHKDTIQQIRKHIGIGLSQGDRMATMAKRLSNQVGVNYRRAMLIARTEVHRAREAGYQESSERISQVLKENDSGYVMTKTWKTMQDKAVRPYRMKRSKGSIGFVMGKGADHVKMHGKTVLVEDEFDLGDGNKTKTPGQSGVASHDCNCRCYLSRDLMTIEEYEKLTGKKLEQNYKVAQYETEEKILLDEKGQLESDKEKLVKQQETLSQQKYDGIWKESVTPADYELKKGSIQAKKDYYNDDILAAQNHTGKYANANMYSDADIANIINKDKKFLKDLDDFEIQGKEYVKIKKQISKIDGRLPEIDDEIKDVRLKLMKAKGIDPDKIQKEIDDIILDIDKLKNPQKYKYESLYDFEITKSYSGKMYFTDDSVKQLVDKRYNLLKQMEADGTLNSHNEVVLKNLEKFYKEIDDIDVNFKKMNLSNSGLTMKSSIKDYSDEIKDALEKAGIDGNDILSFTLPEETVEDLMNYYLKKDQQTAFEKELKKIIKNNSGDAKKFEKELKKLEKKLADKTDELDKIKKRYGLEDDRFSQARKDKALWFTDKNGSATAADKAYRSKAGEVWQKATKAQKDSAYEYTSSYHKYNEPLRGIEYGTNKFKGVGNIDLDDIGVSTGYGMKKGEVKKLIDDLTDYIDMSSYDEDIWVQRGCRFSGMDKFFNIDPDDFYNLSESEMAAKILGTTPTEYGFMSTGTAKGRGLNTNGGVLLNIYAPKGTKMAYVEPFSAFGNGAGRRWDGISTQSSIGHEAEMLLQRNTQFRVIKVEKNAGNWFIDLEVIGQGR